MSQECTGLCLGEVSMTLPGLFKMKNIKHFGGQRSEPLSLVWALRWWIFDLKNEENFSRGRHCLGEHLSLSNPRHRQWKQFSHTSYLCQQMGPNPSWKTHISELCQLKGEAAGVLIHLLPSAIGSRLLWGLYLSAALSASGTAKLSGISSIICWVHRNGKIRGYGQGPNSIYYGGVLAAEGTRSSQEKAVCSQLLGSYWELICGCSVGWQFRVQWWCVTS